MATSSYNPRSTRKRNGSLTKLTDRQRIFVHEYLADEQFNAKRAATKAGYKSPGSAAMKLLQNRVVMCYLGKKLKERMDICEVNAERVLKELCRIGFSNPLNLFDETGKLLPVQEWDEDTARSVSSIKTRVTVDKEGNETTTTEFRFWNKNNALELVAKHLGMLDDRIKMDHGIDDGLMATLLGKIEAERSQSTVIDHSYIEGKVAE